LHGLSEECLLIARVLAANQESPHDFIADSVAPLPEVLRIRTSIVTKKAKEVFFSIKNDSEGARLLKGLSNTGY
jgi:hypothetical protein